MNSVISSLYEPLFETFNMFKSNLCKYDRCNNSSCMFAHSNNELKIPVCYYYFTTGCKHGDYCDFSHDYKMLEKKVHEYKLWKAPYPEIDSDKYITVLILGDEYSGKSTYINYLTQGIIDENYTKTENTTLKTLKLNTSEGKFSLVLWEVKLNDLDYVKYSKAQGAIIMYDSNDRNCLDNLYRYIKIVKLQNIPYIICSNKSDLPNNTSFINYNTSDAILKYNNPPFIYMEMSVFSQFNTKKPISELLKLVTKNKTFSISNEF